MSFDAWIVGFGLARSIIDLKLLGAPGAYSVWGTVIVFDLFLLYQYFVAGRFQPRSVSYAVEAAVQGGGR